MIDLELNSSTDLKREGKSFYWASFFLPRNLKIKAGTLYSICRHFDDVADKHCKDQTNYLKNSIEEIKKNKNNITHGRGSALRMPPKAAPVVSQLFCMDFFCFLLNHKPHLALTPPFQVADNLRWGLIRLGKWVSSRNP